MRTVCPVWSTYFAFACVLSLEPLGLDWWQWLMIATSALILVVGFFTDDEGTILCAPIWTVVTIYSVGINPLGPIMEPIASVF